MTNPVCNGIWLTIFVSSNTFVTATERHADGGIVYEHVFEDKGRKFITKLNIMDESRREPVLPVESELQLELQPKRHTETQTEQASRPERQPERHSEPYPGAQVETEDVPQSKPQPKTQPDPIHEQIKHVAEEAMKIESIRGHLGASVTYLDGLLNIGDVLKDVSHSFQNQPRTDYG